jgi:hypothetical protein
MLIVFGTIGFLVLAVAALWFLSDKCPVCKSRSTYDTGTSMFGLLSCVCLNCETEFDPLNPRNYKEREKRI